MSERIFIWVAHPRSPSFCAALADAYQTGAESRGAVVRRQDLADMVFDRSLHVDAEDVAPPLEPDLVAFQDNLAWAEHVVVLHPLWWGGMPGIAKTLIDRTILPGFAFKYKSRKGGYDKLLAGRTADVMITSDTPPLIDALVYHKTARRNLRNQVLGFCGIKTRRILQFGSVKTSSDAALRRWIDKARRMGASAAC